MDENINKKRSLKLSAISFLKVLKPKISNKRKSAFTKKATDPKSQKTDRGLNPGFFQLNHG